MATKKASPFWWKWLAFYVMVLCQTRLTTTTFHWARQTVKTGTRLPVLVGSPRVAFFGLPNEPRSIFDPIMVYLAFCGSGICRPNCGQSVASLLHCFEGLSCTCRFVVVYITRTIFSFPTSLDHDERCSLTMPHFEVPRAHLCWWLIFSASLVDNYIEIVAFLMNTAMSVDLYYRNTRRRFSTKLNSLYFGLWHHEWTWCL